MPEKTSVKAEELLPHEKWSSTSVYMPQNQKVFLDPAHIAETYLRRPGRFQSPLSKRERMRLKITTALRALDFFHLSNRFEFISPRYPVPFSWTVLIKYLDREGILEMNGGLVTSPLRNDFPRSFFYDLSFDAKLGKAGWNGKRRVTGRGNSLAVEEALSKAVGELLERYFLSGHLVDLVRSATQLKIAGVSFVEPSVLSQFDEVQKQQFPRFRLNSENKFGWVCGFDVLQGSDILVPAQCAFRGHTFDDTEPVLRHPNSNGCAGHFTREEAVLSGIYENVERDGFLIFWLNSIAPPIIDTASIQNPEFQKLLERFSRYRFEAKFLNTTTDIGIPSFLCVLIDRSHRGPRVAVGGGCGWDVEKVMLETGYKTLASFQQTLQPEGLPLPILSEEYIPFSSRSLKKRERVLLWQNPAMYPKIEPFLSGRCQTLTEAFPNLPTFQNVAEEYSHVKNIFRKLGKGYEIYYYEVKHHVLEKIGYHVVKVIIPEIVHLYLNEALPPLGATRLKTVPKTLGYESAKEWNPWPHPFP